MTKSEQAVTGLDVRMNAVVVVVRDGVDTWLCSRTVWDKAMAQLDEQPAFEGPSFDEGEAEIAAYQELCDTTARIGAIASVNGESHGEYEPLVNEACAYGLIDEETAAQGFGVNAEGETARRPAGVDRDGDCVRCGHPANNSSGHGTCLAPCHRR